MKKTPKKNSKKNPKKNPKKPVIPPAGRNASETYAVYAGRQGWSASSGERLCLNFMAALPKALREEVNVRFDKFLKAQARMENNS